MIHDLKWELILSISASELLHKRSLYWLLGIYLHPPPPLHVPFHPYLLFLLLFLQQFSSIHFTCAWFPSTFSNCYPTFIIWFWLQSLCLLFLLHWQIKTQVFERIKWQSMMQQGELCSNEPSTSCCFLSNCPINSSISFCSFLGFG